MTQYKATQKIFLAKYFLKQNTMFTILTWAFSSPRQEPSKSEYDRPLVFLNHLAVEENQRRKHIFTLMQVYYYRKAGMSNKIYWTL